MRVDFVTLNTWAENKINVVSEGQVGFLGDVFVALPLLCVIVFSGPSSPDLAQSQS